MFFIRISIHLLFDPAISLLGLCPREVKTYIHKKTCTGVSTAALFRTATSWKQPRVHQRETGQHVAVCLHHGMLLSNKRKHTPHTGVWISQTLCWVEKKKQLKKKMYCMICFLLSSGLVKWIWGRPKVRRVVSCGGVGGRDRLRRDKRGNSLRDANALYLVRGLALTDACICHNSGRYTLGPCIWLYVNFIPKEKILSWCYACWSVWSKACWCLQLGNAYTWARRTDGTDQW